MRNIYSNKQLSEIMTNETAINNKSTVLWYLFSLVSLMMLLLSVVAALFWKTGELHQTKFTVSSECGSNHQAEMNE